MAIQRSLVPLVFDNPDGSIACYVTLEYQQECEYKKRINAFLDESMHILQRLDAAPGQRQQSLRARRFHISILYSLVVLDFSLVIGMSIYDALVLHGQLDEINPSFLPLPAYATLLALHSLFSVLLVTCGLWAFINRSADATRLFSKLAAVGAAGSMCLVLTSLICEVYLCLCTVRIAECAFTRTGRNDLWPAPPLVRPATSTGANSRLQASTGEAGSLGRVRARRGVRPRFGPDAAASHGGGLGPRNLAPALEEQVGLLAEAAEQQ
ncbi:hypothetical protein PAPYR_7475 [Paratrimastix pyriformis]|uniref:Uncharacterized protein n=1 Tax=Paratrimastix pyriformis TaxID=342808 RepID=A0ABQ8UGB1_9EUKA|nr:hypothetical protein PAPYR_7475 [Paratrimastix pyriformis]